MEVVLAGGASLCIGVTEQSQIGEARRRAAYLAAEAGFNEEQAGAVSIAASELATNLVRHAGSGEFLLRSWKDDDGSMGLEMLAVDGGPGMEDVGRCLRDGFSTGGTSGTGLGAVRRLADDFDLYSVAGMGTVALARFSPGSAPNQSGPAVRFGGVCVPVKGELECGDNWGLYCEQGRAVLMVADGLGHGPGAAEASREAMRTFQQHAGRSPAAILQFMHGAMRSTRGAAVAIAEMQLGRSQITYAGVGNISGVIVAEHGTRSMISYNGILGHEMRKLQEFNYPWEPGSALVMSSDGLGSRWSLDSYPGLVARDPAVIAATLYRDFRRERDDVTVVVVK